MPHDYYTVNDAVGSDTNLALKKNPGITQLYNAIKFSGRTRKKLGIGVFNAITAPEYATISDLRTGVDSSIRPNP